MHRPLIFLTAFLAICASAASAMPPGTSLRPEPRPATSQATPEVTVSSQQSSLAVVRSIRPALRGADVAANAQPIVEVNLRTTPTSDAGFARWIDAFQGRARAQGIRQATLDTAFRGIQLDEQAISRDQNQSEFTRALWDYLDSAVSDARVTNGRAAFVANRQTLEQIEARYQVEAEVVAAVWGLETAYGAMRGSSHIIAAMATLAYEGRRSAFFEAQLIAALQILQSGDTTPENMTGSWAGAMGHTQFMPTSYLDHAVDFTGDGRRDIWSDDPADALASTANYLAAFGWTYGQPWGMEVTLPQGFDYAQTGERTKRSTDYWNRQGVRLADGGGRIPDHGQASILLPAGSQGVALVIFDNFHVIERYNPADAYVIGVGHLSDRIGGGAPFAGSWPRQDRALSRDEREELQRRLTAAGFATDGIDGIIGPNTIEAVRRYQATVGAVPDGYASLTVLQRLR